MGPSKSVHFEERYTESDKEKYAKQAQDVKIKRKSKTL